MQGSAPFSSDALDVFRLALQVTAWGLLGIFVFMILFAAMILALTRLFPHAQPDQDAAKPRWPWSRRGSGGKS